MNNSEEINEIHSLINNLLTQTTILTVKNNVLTTLLLEYISKASPKYEKRFYTLLVDELETSIEDALAGLDEILCQDGDSAFLLRQKMQTFAEIQNLKRNDRYIKK